MHKFVEEAKKGIRSTVGKAVEDVDKDLLAEHFRTFWNSKPNEDEFESVMGNVLLTARMLYIMRK